MPTFREDIIKLAAEHPEYRADLVPLLERTASEGKVAGISGYPSTPFYAHLLRPAGANPAENMWFRADAKLKNGNYSGVLVTQDEGSRAVNGPAKKSMESGWVHRDWSQVEASGLPAPVRARFDRAPAPKAAAKLAPSELKQIQDKFLPKHSVKTSPEDLKLFKAEAKRAGASKDSLDGLLEKLELHHEPLPTLSEDSLIDYGMIMSIDPDDMNALIEALAVFKRKRRSEPEPK